MARIGGKLRSAARACGNDAEQGCSASRDGGSQGVMRDERGGHGASAWRAARVTLAASLALCLIAPFALAGCSDGGEKAGSSSQESSAAQPQEGYTFTDDLGNQVTVNNPQRVVACMGSFADVWQLAGGTLVGASQDAFADYGIDEANVQSVGDFSSLSLESILACNPDFVIMTGSSSGRGGGVAQTDLKDALEASGVSVAYFNVTTFDDYLRMLRVCCDITGRDDLYASNGDDLKAKVSDAIDAGRKSVPQGARVALLTTYSQGIRVLPSSSTAGAILNNLGAVNIADENPSLLSDFGLEALLKTDPDYIFLVPMGDDDAAAERNLKAATMDVPAWSELSAVKKGHCVVLDKALFLYKPNAHWDEAYKALADAFEE
ncbi:MAG TPA: ABC transporter substrate-binding protein [Slackia equolifaciens]|uniref:ABC transporter substrate-binding protein n=1 Tax=Slackia equolifaciens TaxID=498718 RepID=A0A9D2UVN7_9ACTN|nr:ABC transporter substrate-binding protein [Slackia equolifaciens]